MNIILASGSKYRKALLDQLDFPFTQISPDIDEDKYKHEVSNPKELAELLSLKKAQAIFENHPNSIIIGGDQVASFKNHILGKPHTKEKAFEQLKLMSGGTHQLITSICLKSSKNEVIFTNTTGLTMRVLSDKQIERYIELDMPLDCAGSYKLEEHGIGLFSSIQTTDHSAIMGIPLIELKTQLEQFGVEFLIG